MNKHDLARRLARKSHRSRAEAADAVDRLVHDMLKDLKRPPVKRPPERSSSAGVIDPKGKT
jgi:hypothetical protein